MKTLRIALLPCLLLLACDDGSQLGVGSMDLSAGEPAFATPPASCTDGKKNEDETDVDCGGAMCPACAIGQRCALDRDCQDMLCSQGTCVTAGCTDGHQDGDETDVDCGGRACKPCFVGKGCTLGIDCATRICRVGTCQGSVTTTMGFVGTRTFVDGQSCTGPTVADFTGDGAPDVVTYCGSNNFYELVNNGKGALVASPGTQILVTLPRPVRAADVDANGRADAVLLDGMGGLLVMLSKAGGGFLGPASYPVGNRVVGSAIGDFDGDHNLDVAVGTSGKTVMFWGTGHGLFAPAAPTANVTEYIDLFAVDLDGNGRSDLITSSQVFLSGGGAGANRTFTAGTMLAMVSGYWDQQGIASGDWNSDGKVDLVTGGAMQLLLGDGKGGFDPHGPWSNTSYPSVVVGDFDADGYLDAAALQNGDSAVHVFTGDGNTRLPNDRQPIALNGNGGYLGAADMDGDGKIDLVVSENDLQGSWISVWLNRSK